jgi:acyl-coenzyme A thioesterase PaaI-like protein
MTIHFDLDRDQDPDDARFRLAEAARRVIEELTSSSASSEAFEEARDLVERAADVLAAREHGRDYQGGEASLAEQIPPATFLDFSPLIGPLNPLAPPIVMEIGADSVVGTVVFGNAYEGPPGCVHGGFIAASFDEVLGMTQSLGGAPGMTGRLEISYRSPTPLHRPLRFEGRIERVDGRKIHTRATLHHGEALCAEAYGLFISVKPEVFAHLWQTRASPAASTGAGPSAPPLSG